ncbi:MAG: CDP-alcohol phosphatidyltransferase family protein [Promethearchaeota archaeon]
MPRESFKEFRQIIQGTKLEKQRKKKDWWHWIYRFFSRYITWVLVKTPISANIITITGILIGLIGLFLIGIGNNFLIIFGFILLYIYYLSDEVDGEVARYKKQTSSRGIYYDEIGHLFFQGWFFFSFGYSIYRLNFEFMYIFLAFIATFFLIGIRTVRKISIIAFAKGNIKKGNEIKTRGDEEKSSKKSFIKLVKSISINLVNGFSHTHMITTMFFVGFLLYIYFEIIWVIELLMISYVLFLLFVFLTFMILKARTIEKDARKHYEKKFLENP